MVLAQILIGQPAADALEIGINGVGYRPIVKGIAAALGNLTIGARKVRIAENLAHLRGVAVRRVGPICIGALLRCRAQAR